MEATRGQVNLCVALNYFVTPSHTRQPNTSHSGLFLGVSLGDVRNKHHNMCIRVIGGSETAENVSSDREAVKLRFRPWMSG